MPNLWDQGLGFRVQGLGFSPTMKELPKIADRESC